MSRRKPRSLRPDEIEVWGRIARTARPMHSKRAKPAQLMKELPDSETEVSETRPRFEISPFSIGSRATDSLSGRSSVAQSGEAGPAALNMDRTTFQRMKRGKVRPEARIDLHGMTADAAHQRLTAFLFQAQASGKRLVLVITGKGRSGSDEGPIPYRMGVLRRSLPEWLNRPPLKAIVQQMTEAHQRHGGSGAFYVYLRRLG